MSLVIYPILAEHATNDESAVALRSISRRGPPDAMVQEKSKWSYYHKPITLIIFGGIVFLTGILYTIFYFTKYVEVPYALGPVFLSIGLMFLVTGLVWVPIVTEAVRHKGILRTIDTPRSTAT
ncbi:hypothetical protein FKM82_002773 [Ascaphus truei]